jgi:hypothetical protein
MAPSSLVAQLNREQLNVSANLKPGINAEKIARKIIASDVYRIYVQGEILRVKL